MAKDKKGYEVKTHEGYTGYINPEIEMYFVEKYSQASFGVVPGHWPSMESKEDVDKWINEMESLMNMTFEHSEEEKAVYRSLVDTP